MKVYVVKVYIVAGVNTQSPVLNENPDSLVSSFITVQCQLKSNLHGQKPQSFSKHLLYVDLHLVIIVNICDTILKAILHLMTSYQLVSR